jgi:hypothetical protein
MAPTRIHSTPSHHAGTHGVTTQLATYPLWIPTRRRAQQQRPVPLLPPWNPSRPKTLRLGHRQTHHGHHGQSLRISTAHHQGAQCLTHCECHGLSRPTETAIVGKVNESTNSLEILQVPYSGSNLFPVAVYPLISRHTSTGITSCIVQAQTQCRCKLDETS